MRLDQIYLPKSAGRAMSSALEAFLARNSVIPTDSLPVVHSTKAYNFKSIMNIGGISPHKCDVFENESLNYFFVGRPSYKYMTNSSHADHWELPCCFLFQADSIKKPKRIYPFDSGAFTKRRYPDYIGMMPRDEFLANVPDAPKKIIGSFFGSSKKYFNLQPKSKESFEHEYSINPFDAEISALLRLGSERTSENFDDRRFAIEIQTEESVLFNIDKPLAVILPEQYLDVEGVLDKIVKEWGAEALSYPTFSLSVSAYHALIYKEILEFYTRMGFI